MVRFSLISLLITGASAAPEWFQLNPRKPLAEQAVCNRDDCYHQISADAHPGGPARGSAGCAAVLATTVRPCPITSTATATATTTRTSNVKVTVTSTSTVTSPTTTTTTVTVTVTTAVTTTMSSSAGSAVAGSAVAGSAVAGSAVAAKRAIEAQPTTVCSAVSSSSTAVPKYASSCHNLAQYSSACSCNGIAGSATTLAPVTSTTTLTKTTTATATNTITAVDDQTVTITPTVTATATTTETVAPTPPSCTNGINCVANEGFYVVCEAQGGYGKWTGMSVIQGVPDYLACIQHCTGIADCNAFNFFSETGECDLYYNIGYQTFDTNALDVAGYYYQSCSG